MSNSIRLVEKETVEDNLTLSIYHYRFSDGKNVEYEIKDVGTNCCDSGVLSNF